jgi:hypothetical protein
MGEGDGGRWSRENMNCVTVAVVVVVRSNRKGLKERKRSKKKI